MEIQVNGVRRQVASAAEVMDSVQPHDELILVVERPGQPGVHAQAAGTVADGFVVGHRDRAGTDHTTSNHGLRPTTVVAMLDRFALDDPNWAGSVSWSDGTGPNPAAGAVIRTVLAGVVAVVVAVVAVSLARTYGTVRYLCGRDGDDVVSTQPAWGSRWTDNARSRCTFADGERVELASIVGDGADVAESIGTTIVMFALVVGLWVLLARLVGGRATTSPGR